MPKRKTANRLRKLSMWPLGPEKALQSAMEVPAPTDAKPKSKKKAAKKKKKKAKKRKQ